MLRIETTAEMFAGIGGFRLAAEARGINTMWANDNDSRACQIYRKRFRREPLVEADITKVWEGIPTVDLLTAGFPCQPFSSAGKKKGIRDPRGTLFQTIVNVLSRTRPRYFLLENVKRLLSMEGGAHFATVINGLSELDYQIEWRLVNVMDLGLPQNRQRVVIAGRRADSEIEELTVRLASQADLKAAMAQDYDGLSDQRAWRPIVEHGRRFPNWGLASKGRFFAANLLTFSEARPHTLLRSVLEDEVDDSFDFTDETVRRLGDNTPVDDFVQGVEILSNQQGGARMGYTIFGIDGVAPTLTSTTSRHYERYKIGDRYRRLTNVEYARIQGFSDDHCSAVSVYNQYALYGNAIPPQLAGWAIDHVSTGWPLESRPTDSQLRLVPLGRV